MEGEDNTAWVQEAEDLLSDNEGKEIPSATEERTLVKIIQTCQCRYGTKKAQGWKVCISLGDALRGGRCKKHEIEWRRGQDNPSTNECLIVSPGV